MNDLQRAFIYADDDYDETARLEMEYYEERKKRFLATRRRAIDVLSELIDTIGVHEMMLKKENIHYE